MRKRHGMEHPLYNVWMSMRKRCNNPNEKCYKHYGGRGIKVCEEWNSFLTFFSDMKDGYKKGLQLDRIDNNKGYSKDNCRWATVSENCSNRRTSIIHNGVCAKKKSLELGASASLVKRRIRRGWSKDEAFNKPPERYVTYMGMTQKEASLKLGSTFGSVVSNRLRRGWDIKEAFTKPLKK